MRWSLKERVPCNARGIRKSKRVDSEDDESWYNYRCDGNVNEKECLIVMRVVICFHKGGLGRDGEQKKKSKSHNVEFWKGQDSPMPRPAPRS